MTTVEILSNFLKGNEVATITEKQKSWLLGQAEREGVKTQFDGFHTHIYFNDCHYNIKNCHRPFSAYGGGIGKAVIPNRFKLEKMYTIKFDSTGLTEVCRKYDMEHYKKEGHSFQIINLLDKK